MEASLHSADCAAGRVVWLESRWVRDAYAHNTEVKHAANGADRATAGGSTL